MFGLSHKFPPVKRLTTITGPVMRDLSYSIEQSCHLVIYYEGAGHIVVQQDSPSERVFSVRLGAKAPLINTCSGHILLAFADESTRQRMTDKIPEDHPSSDQKIIDKIIKKVISRGYESIKSEQAQGVQDIGYPVFDYTGQVVAALVVPFLAFLDGSHPIAIPMAQEKLMVAANEVSDMLGYRLD